MAEAVIFDLDGVIVHSEPTHLLAVREALEPLGVRIPEAMYYEQYVHMPDRGLIARALEDAGVRTDEPQRERLLACKHDVFERLQREGGGVGVYPGVLELLAACAQRVPVALCTAAQRRTVESVLRPRGVLRLFRVVTTADDVARSKPDPMPYSRTCERLGFAPASCVAIEDTPGGVRSAKDAGCAVVAVGHTVGRERLHDADRFVERIGDLSVNELLAFVGT
jgi:beta-phosphoglucomutase